MTVTFQSGLGETLNLTTFAESSTNKKRLLKCHMSGVTCHMSRIILNHFTCNMSRVMWRMSNVTCHRSLAPAATAIYPPPAFSPNAAILDHF